MSILSQAERTRHITLCAMMTVFAMLLSYLESLLPLQLLIPLPGFRLGLANVAVMAVFCLVSPMEATIVSFVRILLMGLLFGSATSLYFSFLGGLCSYLMLLLLSRVGKKCSFVGASILSAAAHNIGQICAAVTLFGPSLVFSYLPALLFASVIYGGAVGFLLNALIPKLKRILFKLIKKEERT